MQVAVKGGKLKPAMDHPARAVTGKLPASERDYHLSGPIHHKASNPSQSNDGPHLLSLSDSAEVGRSPLGRDLLECFAGNPWLRLGSGKRRIENRLVEPWSRRSGRHGVSIQRDEDAGINAVDAGDGEFVTGELPNAGGRFAGGSMAVA